MFRWSAHQFDRRSYACFVEYKQLLFFGIALPLLCFPDVNVRRS
jgi:hypothetical protein